MIRHGVAVVMIGALLAGCGSTTEDRGLSGAGIGAAAGAVVGAVTGLSIVEGVVIGAVAGGAVGVLTDDKQVNLGKPAWQRDAKADGDGDQRLVQDIQTSLTRRGFDPGPADGRMGPRTRSAISDYQRQHKLLVDGRPSPELLNHLQSEAGRG
jgi:peptidoglycan hydrolase-like protein with peptidoglycan-binding domain